MIIYLNRATGEAFITDAGNAEDHLRKVLFTEKRRSEGDYDRLAIHSSESVRVRVLSTGKLDVTTLGIPDNIIT